jgi:hypothetical protein
MNEEKLQKIIAIVKKSLFEETPTMNLGAGQIAGTIEAGDDPPVRKRKKYIFGKGYRKIWKP